MDSTKISVMTPVYNEKDNLETFINQVEQVLQEAGETFEIIIIDDNSPDGTGELAEELATKYGNIKVLHRPEKKGLGTAYKEGFNLTQGELIITIDSDQSHDPQALPRMIKKAKEADTDIVIGSRFTQGGSIEGRSFWRDLMSVTANRFIRTITAKNIKDWTSGLRVYKRQVWTNTMPHVECIKWDFQFESLYKSIKDGYQVKETPILFHERAGGTSKFNLNEAIYFVFSIFKILLTT